MNDLIDKFKTVVEEFISGCQKKKLILNKSESVSLKILYGRHIADVWYRCVIQSRDEMKYLETQID